MFFLNDKVVKINQDPINVKYNNYNKLKAVMGKILLIEDENLFAKPLMAYCQTEGLDIHLENTGESGLKYLSENYNNIDLLLLDMVLNQGEIQGEDVLRSAKFKYPDLPVICMSAIRLSEIQQVIGLTLGAEDYYDKSAGLPILFIKIKNLIEKNKVINSNKKQFSTGSLFYDNLSEKFSYNGSQLSLRGSQYKILLSLYNNPDQILPHERLRQDADLSPTAEIQGYVLAIRKSLANAGVENPTLLIQTETGRGYRYNP